MTGKTMVALACNQATPSNLVVYDGVVYWTNYAAASSGGAIMSAPTSGSTPPKVVVANQAYPWGIATDGKNVYWTNYGQAGANDASGPTGVSTNTMGAVMQASVGGEDVTVLAQALVTPFGVAVDATDVYFTTGLALPKPGADGGSTGGTVQRVPIFVSGVPDAGVGATLVDMIDGPANIVVGGGFAYYSAYAGGTVNKIATKPGGPANSAVLACGADKVGGAIAPLGLALDSAGSHIYYADRYGDVYRAATTPLEAGPCNPGVLFTTPSMGPWGLAIDSTNVYVTSAAGNFVDSVPIATGTAVNLTPGNNGIQNPTGIAVDSTGVYVAGIGVTPGTADGHVWRISPP